MALSFPPPQSGRRSSSSVRAMHRRNTGAFRERSATCSTRSRKIELGPLEVVHHDRPAVALPLGTRAACERQRASPPASTHTTLSGSMPSGSEHLDERPVRDPLAVRQATAAEDVRSVRDALEEVRDEPGLPDACRPEQREEPARAVRDGVFVVAPEPLPLALATDERCLEPARDQFVADHVEQPRCGDGLGLALQLERRHFLDPGGIPHEQPRLGADKDLACRGGLLEPGSHVDGIAGDEGLTLAADHDLAGVDADAGLQRVQSDDVAHLDRGTNSPERVVLVRDRDAEHRHHRVADELLHRPTVALDDRPQVLEVAPHACAQGLGIGRLAERGRAHHVAKENRDDLPLLAHGLRGQRRPARAAEARVVGVLAPAAGAGDHPPESTSGRAGARRARSRPRTSQRAAGRTAPRRPREPTPSPPRPRGARRPRSACRPRSR